MSLFSASGEGQRRFFVPAESFYAEMPGMIC